MDTLTESDVPSPDADWETIGDFAILYDGYEACGSVEACAEIAKAQKHDTLENLRICLFMRNGNGVGKKKNPMKGVVDIFIPSLKKYGHLWKPVHPH